MPKTMENQKGASLGAFITVLVLVLILVGVVVWRYPPQGDEEAPSRFVNDATDRARSDVHTANTPNVLSNRDDDDQQLHSINSATDVLTAIKKLESKRDPKCHSTACRFEDFIYGTPLEAEARAAKVGLQKTLIRQIWRDAAKLASTAGRNEVRGEDVQAVAETIFRTTSDDDGVVIAKFEIADAIELSPVRVRQIASIAYSLRAILSVQQDSILGDPPSELPLANSGVDAMRSAVDIVTLSALQVADIAARKDDSPMISAGQLEKAWQKLVAEAPAATGASDSIAAAPRDDNPTKEKLRDQLFTMIDAKRSAYRAYNEVTPQEAEQRFIKNIKGYYALYMTPLRKEWINRLVSSYDDEMTRFSSRLLDEAGVSAAGAGRAVIRSADATAAVETLLPHAIDDFEDVTFFHRLDGDHVTLESYDCDSFRDTGSHWYYFRKAYEANDTALPPDPFAAEIMTEAISGYGVLLFRLAGRVAMERSDAPALRPSHLEEARRQIIALAARHHSTPDQEDNVAAIISTESGPMPRDDSGLLFADVTAKIGVEFRHDSAKWLHEFRRSSILAYPTFSGGGVAAEDIDNDGSIDLLFLGGTGNVLYFGDGRGGFEKAGKGLSDLLSSSSEGSIPAESRQPLIADFDNDGRQDIFIACTNSNHRMYRNLGNRQFEDVSDSTGLGGAGLIGGPATTFDFDNDGLLDLYIAYFGDYLNGAAPKQDRDNKNALPNKLFRNLGGMRFQDVTEGSGTADTGWCQAVSHTDFDRDGWQDIVVANDFGRNALLRNLGGGRFENVARDLGHTKAYHSMNVSFTDLNRDGFPDIYISNIATMVKDNKYAFPDVNTTQKLDLSALSNMLVKEANILYLSKREDGKLHRYAPSTDIERGESTTGWAWDAEFLDFDNDGDDDLYVVNGANDYNIFSEVLVLQQDSRKSPQHFQLSNRRETNVFYVNDNGMLMNRSSASGANFSGNSRSTAYFDWDEDGDLDIAVANFQSPAVMLRNENEQVDNRWLTVRLIGDQAKKSNRDAIGARIIATSDDGLYAVREIQGGSGFLSQNPKEQHFGLGSAAHVDLTIHWPGGDVQKVGHLPAGKRYVIREDEAPSS